MSVVVEKVFPSDLKLVFKVQVPKGPAFAFEAVVPLATLIVPLALLGGLEESLIMTAVELPAATPLIIKYGYWTGRVFPFESFSSSEILTSAEAPSALSI